MKVRKWVDMGQEVTIEIGVDDVRAALAEAFAVVTEDRLGEPRPNRAEIAMTFNSIGTFLRAITDEQIGILNPQQRELICKFLTEQAARFGGKLV